MDQTSPKKYQKPPGPRFSFSKLFKIAFIGLLLYPAFLYGQQALQKFVGRIYFDTHLVHELEDYEKFKQKFKAVGDYYNNHYNWPTWYRLWIFPPDDLIGIEKVKSIIETVRPKTDTELRLYGRHEDDQWFAYLLTTCGGVFCPFDPQNVIELSEDDVPSLSNSRRCDEIVEPISVFTFQYYARYRICPQHTDGPVIYYKLQILAPSLNFFQGLNLTFTMQGNGTMGPGTSIPINEKSIWISPEYFDLGEL